MKSLSELDQNYKQKSQYFSVDEKINYCNDLIDRFQNIVSKNKAFLSERVKQEFVDIISSAQEEIKNLET